MANVKTGELLENGAVKARFAAQYPYGEWTRGILRLQDIPGPVAPAAPLGDAERARLCAAFGYAHEDIEDMILPMAVSGVEPTVSMGADEPLATLSHAHPPLFAYFKQRFAQVTNPPIDAIREKVKTDESIYIGDDGNLLSPAAENCRVIELDSPILTAEELERIRGLRHPDFRVRVISLLYPRAKNLQSALAELFAACDRACREGVNIVILSDRGAGREHLAIPSLLAVSALEQHLVRKKKRTAVSVLLESGEPRDVHQLAMLIGFGARAVNPYLAHECVLSLCESGTHRQSARAGHRRLRPGAVLRRAQKYASKMGVSTLQAYQSAVVRGRGPRRGAGGRLFHQTRPTIWAARTCAASKKTAATIMAAPFSTPSAAGRCPASAATACAPAMARRNISTALRSSTRCNRRCGTTTARSSTATRPW